MAGPVQAKRIWIDLDNSPHVPFFDPIITELKALDYAVTVTARDCAQTCGLADLHHLQYSRVGRHYGRHKLLKVLGTVYRAFQLSKSIYGRLPDLAVSHGSRAQMLSASMLRIPVLVMGDYEHTKGNIRSNWVMVPEVIDNDRLGIEKERILKYPGIKEDVYVPFFRPNPQILQDIGVSPSDILVTIRPPATEAHYHNPESESLFLEAVNRIGETQTGRMVILPRSAGQKQMIEAVWPRWCAERRIILPPQVVDGLNLLWYSDLAISGGGTMNREAAALGVPVYSIFRGKIGAVDKHLAETRRLVLLESLDDVRTNLSIRKREISSVLPKVNEKTLNAVVDGIIKVLHSN